MKTTLLTTVAVNLGNGRDYIGYAIEMIESYLEHTDFSVLISTNDITRVNRELNSSRVTAIQISDDELALSKVHGGFDEVLKLLVLASAFVQTDCNDDPYDVIYLTDSDLVLAGGFDQESYNRLVNISEVDLWTSIELAETPLLSFTPNVPYLFMGDPVTTASMSPGTTAHTIDGTINKALGPMVHVTREDRLIFTNRDKLRQMINLHSQQQVWHSMLGEDTGGYRVIGNEHAKGFLSAVFGESAYMADARVSMVCPKLFEFARYEVVVDYTTTGKKLDRCWVDEAGEDNHQQRYIKRTNTKYISEYNRQHG